MNVSFIKEKCLTFLGGGSHGGYVQVQRCRICANVFKFF